MKRLISLFTVFMLFSSLLVPCVFAEEAPNTDAGNFELISALGIDNNINKENAQIITRSEFTAMAVRSLNINTFGAYDGSFTDVSEDAPFAPEIYMAKSLRMTNGTSEGTFSPDAELSGNVALKMLLTAMGYETVAQAKGGYPAGYVAIDRTIGLLKGVSSFDALTVYDAKVIITNALKADMAVFSGIENEQIITSTTGGRTLLSERFGLEKLSGVVDVAGFITYDNTVTEDDAISLAGKNFKSRIDATPYFGMDVTAYHKDGEVYAVEANDNNKIVIVDAEEVGAFSNNILTTYNSDKEYRYRISPSLSFIKNGRLISHTNDSFKIPHGTFKLIDNNADNAYDIIVAESYEYYVISGINPSTSTIYDNNSSIGPISFDGGAYEVALLLDSKSNKTEVSALSKNEVVQVMRSDDKKVCIVRCGRSEEISGKVEEITTEGYVVNGVEYIPNTYFKSRGIIITAGSEYTFLLAPDKTITTTIGDGSNGISYGYLVDVNDTTGISSGTFVKVLTANGDIEVFKLADYIILEGEKAVSRKDAKVISALYNGEYPKYQLIRYRTNKDGCINLIDTADGPLNTTWNLEQVSSADNSLTQYVSKKEVEFRKTTSFGAPYFSFAKSIIFAVPKDLRSDSAADYSDKLFVVKSVGDMLNERKYIGDAYDFDNDYYPRVTVIYTETGKSVDSQYLTTANGIHIVYQINDTADKDGNITKVIRTFCKGTYYSYIVNPDALQSIIDGSNLPSPGDIIHYSLDKNNYINGIKIDSKYNPTTQKHDVKYVSAYDSAISFIAGTVKAIGDGMITLNIGSGDYVPSNVQLTVAPLPLSNAFYTVYNTKTHEVTTGTVTDVIPAVSVGMQKATKVLCYLSYYGVTNVFIYTE